MLVYGDRSETVDPGKLILTIGESLAAVAAMPADLERHSRLIAVLIETGRLLQGVEDAGAPGHAKLNTFLAHLASAALRSWDSGFRSFGDLPPTPVIDGLPAEVALRMPEGFAHYAVYPEAYAAAARRLSLRAPPKVIGIRSIGTTLAAIVSAALGAPPPFTVRPFGHPFAREVRLPESVLEGDPHFVVVDEGPGLSGSSFGAVARWLEQRGVPLERIAFLPSHWGDPGPEASEEDRKRWKRAQRTAAELDPHWLVSRFGPLERLYRGEQLKFLAGTGPDRVLLRFAGLGPVGDLKLRMAEALHAAGRGPRPIGLFHGFLAERWYGAARPLGPADRPITEIAHYIAARARLFPADRASGASLDELARMARRNVSLALGAEAAARVPAPPASSFTRIRTDNRLDRDKWLRLGDGCLLKTDALDHHQSHDLVGCQNAAWDVAGAIVEFDLNQAEAAQLIAESGPAAECDLIDFFLIAYASFRLGQATLPSGNNESGGRYRQYLHAYLCPFPNNNRRTAVEGAKGTKLRLFGSRRR